MTFFLRIPKMLLSGRRSCGSRESNAPSWRLGSSQSSLQEEVLWVWREVSAGCWGELDLSRCGGKPGSCL